MSPNFVDVDKSDFSLHLQGLGTVLHEAVERACELRDVGKSETELRLSAHKLAGLVSEMEVTMVQTEEMLAEESRWHSDLGFRKFKNMIKS